MHCADGPPGGQDGVSDGADLGCVSGASAEYPQPVGHVVDGCDDRRRYHLCEQVMQASGRQAGYGNDRHDMFTAVSTK
jgi:hypothetical protein